MIYFNCNWVDTRWQKYSTHLHTHNTQINKVERNKQNKSNNENILKSVRIQIFNFILICNFHIFFIWVYVINFVVENRKSSYIKNILAILN